MGKKHFCFFQTAETGNRTPNSGVKGSGANHYPRAPAQKTFKVASGADISLLVTKITFVVAEIIMKEHVLTSSVAKITYVVAEVTLKVVVVTSSVARSLL